MAKHKLNKIFFIILMVTSLMLIAHDFINVMQGFEYEIWNLSHIGLFVFGVYLFYLNRKNERKMKEDAQRSLSSIDEKALDVNIIKTKGVEELKKGMQTLWIIWGAMFGSLLVYLIVCHVMADRVKMKDIPFALFRNILYIIVAVELVIAYYIRKLLLKVRPAKQGSTTLNEATGLKYRPALSKYTSALIVSLAIVDSIGIYGVVFFFMSRDFQSLYIFTTISAIAMFIYRPKMEEIEKLAMDLKGKYQRK